MSNPTKTAQQIKSQITRFSGKVSQELDKPKRRFINEMIYGIQASKDVKLANIARALDEDISLIKTVGRLSRQIGSKDLTPTIGNRLIEEGKPFIGKDTVLALDLSDISKEYSQKQEGLAPVRDGSTGKIKDGWPILAVVGADVRGDKVIPLYAKLYTKRGFGFKSENLEILGAIDDIIKGIGKKGVWALDRGGDRWKLFVPILERKLKFVVRMMSLRDMIDTEKRVRNIAAIARGTRCSKKAEIVIHPKGEPVKKKTIRIGFEHVSFTFEENKELTLVVIKGMGKKPLMLLTNLKVETAEDTLKIMEIYLTGWKCEESFRFIKEAYQLEDVRVLKYEGLRNIVSLIMAVFFFVSVVLGAAAKLRILLKKVYEKSKRLFEIPPFKQYAICDGIYNLLFGRKFSREDKESIPQTPQLWLPLNISEF